MAGIDYDKFALAMATAVAAAMREVGVTSGGPGRVSTGGGEKGCGEVVGGGGSGGVEVRGSGGREAGGTVDEPGEVVIENIVAGQDSALNGVEEPVVVLDGDGGGLSRVSSGKSWSEVAVQDKVTEEETSDGGSASDASAVRGGVTRVVDSFFTEGNTVGFMAQYVRTPRVKELECLMTELSGSKIPRSAYGDLAMARYTAATLPAAFIDGRARLKALAGVGDAALTLALMSYGYRKGKKIDSLQVARGLLTDGVLARAFAVSKLASHVVVAGDVNLANTKTGATALEAFAGVLSLYCNRDAVQRFMESFNLQIVLSG